MKTRTLLLVSATATFFASAVGGCFAGISDDIAKLHRGNDVPVVFVTAPEGLSSRTFDIEFSVFDNDSDNVMFWDRCPYPDAAPEYGGAPILRIGFSVDGGDFQKIDPADLLIDGAPIVVPTCGQVDRFDDEIRYTANAVSNGELHILTWDSLTYVPESGRVVVRISANDNSFTSDPGDSEEFSLANSAAFLLDFQGSRPGDVLSVELLGLLTHWGATTTTGASDNVFLSNIVFSSSSAGTATLTHGPDTDQNPRTLILTTPDADVPDPPPGDEEAKAVHWTCAGVGEDVEQYETIDIGDIDQYICDQSSFVVEGTLFDGGVGGFLSGDADAMRFVAASNGNLAFSLDWDSSNPGDVDDYDIFLFNANGVGELTGAGCYTINKPEVCATAAPLVAGTEYLLVVGAYIGADNVAYTATITYTP